MAASQKPNGEGGGELRKLFPVTMRWDFANQRVTLLQKQSELAIHPAEVTLTFDSVELIFFMLYQAALTSRGVLAQAQQPGPIAVVGSVPPHAVPPSAATSDAAQSPFQKRLQ